MDLLEKIKSDLPITVADVMDKKEVKHLGSTFAYGEDVPVSQGTLIKKKPPRVIVVIESGMCSGVYSDFDVDVDVLDYDNMRAAECGADKAEYDCYKNLETEIEDGLESRKLKSVY